MNSKKILKYAKIIAAIAFGLLFFQKNSFAQKKAEMKNMDMTVYKFMDKEGKKTSISDLKGKYVFVDVWASWCRPCINKFPAFDSLKVALKDKNIVCLQISIDAQERRWRNGMGFNGRIEDQWFINGDPNFMKDLDVAYIPRYIIIDRKGKLINPKVDWKDNPQMLSELLKLKGI